MDRPVQNLLVQLFANLVENALNHTPSGTAVAMRFLTRSTSAIAEIADDGPGIPDEERQSVLRRFYRLERSRTTSGNGLGLNMASAVAVLHGGRIEMLDNAPGLRAVVHLPAAVRTQ